MPGTCPDRVVAEIARFDPSLPFEEASTPPASWYTDPELAALERTAVFGRSWQLVARTAQLAAPGSRVAGCHAGLPWVVVRGRDGTLRAFVNVCRHKATQVAPDGESRGETLVCPYHGWTYALDGALRTAPGLGAVRGFDRDAHALLPLAVETWGPFVLVHGDPGRAPPLAAQVRELDARLAATDWTDLTWVGQRSYDVPCNWKAFCDNYLDGGYHIAHLHPTLDAQLDMSSYRTELFERVSIQGSAAAGARGGAQQLHPPAARLDCDPAVRIGGGSLYAFVYPNLMLNRYGPVLDTNLVLPVAPDRCRVVFEFFFAETGDEAARDFIGRSLAQTDVTQQEDVAISARVQVGLASGRFDTGRYAAPETAAHHFHRLLAADLRAAAGLGG